MCTSLCDYTELPIPHKNLQTFPHFRSFDQAHVYPLSFRVQCCFTQLLHLSSPSSLYLCLSLCLSVCLSVSFFSLSNAIGGLKRVRPYVPIKILETIYKSLIQPHFDYCDKVWSNLSVTQSLRLQKLQNRAARVILSANYDGRSADLLESLQWDNSSQRRDKHMALLMCKTLQNKTPNYLRNMFSHNPRGDK